MKYNDYLDVNKKEVVEKLEIIFVKNKVEPVGKGYIDCIVMKDNLEQFIKEVSDLGVLISSASWWCYVNPNEYSNAGCPHGMGGPNSIYYDGWFSELQNDFYEADDELINNVLRHYDQKLIYTLNLVALDGIRRMLEKPFKYTQKDYIRGNRCVNPGLWLLVPDDWERNV